MPRGSEARAHGEVRLAIIIPVYNNWADTLDCLRHLAAQQTPAFQVLIADDGSPEPAPDELRQFSFANYHRGPNLGFAGNSNRGARLALESGATHLLFLNNDTTFSPRFVEAWLRAIAERPDGIMSPLIYWFHAPNKVWISGGRASIFLPYFRPNAEYRCVTRVDMVCGCAMLVPGDVWRALGGFDERFVTYYEDYDFMMRAADSGCQAFVVPDPDLRVWHKVSGSFRGTGVWRQQYRLLASRLLFIRKHYQGAMKAASFSLTAIHIAAQMLLALPELPDVRKLRQAAHQGLGRADSPLQPEADA